MPSDVRGRMQATTSRLKQHDVQGWYQELTRAYGLSVKHGLGLHELDSRIKVCGNAVDPVIVVVGGPHTSFPVNVSMPNAILRREFDRWLAEVRKQLSSPVVKPGRGAFNDLFDDIKFRHWRNTKIVEFIELLAWRGELGSSARKGLPESTLGGWINRHTSKDVNTTKRVLRAALACLPSLAAQFEYECIQTQGDRELIAARIAKQLAASGYP
jgi:hypothetical protein